MTVAVLFARADSNYKQLPGVEVFDIERDARTYDGPWPVIAHPPCRGWGRLRKFAKVRPDERNLARLGVALVRAYGGVLEHPEGSTLWNDQQLPAPGEVDQYGGWTHAISQHWFGHRAEKLTLLYIVGVRPVDVPPLPMLLGGATHIISQARPRKDGSRLVKGMPGWRPEVTKAEREHTPPALAAWLVEIAQKCKR
jgi:hypothetical protein